ncbi:lipopolysaccharide biosynthesis protein [Clostridium tarantellae]|uniref:Oligosaccharide flippase family protein n=1 Tax=Clostridium tarantellae TaxID=39493 RepID=A0A6I1MG17_9CLOT|nr:hypothetical protein [Clostridium tarantellae]MPQ42305.1 hypothetical protein [Clostridium tarantellae]
MRVKNSIKNISISIFSQVVMVFLGFATRKIFLDSLGTEYLGINGVLTNVISMLGLAESGIGISIVYNLYKPLAANDKEKIIALVQLYKKVYGVLAIIIFLLSFIIFPFLKVIIGDKDIPFIGLVYFLFVIKNMISYLNAHKWSLINADQKAYVLAKNNLIFQIVTTLMKIIILVKTNSYILYLLSELIIFCIQNIVNGSIVNKRYPYIKTKTKYAVDKTLQNNIITNTKALFLHNIGTYCVFSTDNLLISAFVNISAVGKYSNYTMIIGQVSGLIYPIIGGISHSVGNLIAIENEEKNYSVFKVMYLINFWIYSCAVIFLYNLLQPFINWWLGEGYLLDNLTFIIILVNYYILGLRGAIGTFKTKAGIFVEDRFFPLIEAVINLVSSIILVKYLGLGGIFLGTTISTLSIVFWNVPRLVYKNVFKIPVRKYFYKYLFYLILTICTGIITTILCNSFFEGYTFLSLVFRGIICIAIPNIVYLLIFFKTEEFKYIKNKIQLSVEELIL